VDVSHSGHDSIELLAAAFIVVGGAIFTGISFLSRPARPGPAAFAPTSRADAGAVRDGITPAVGRSLALIAAGLSAGAAVIHLVAAPTHYLEIGDLAAGFLASAAFQGWWAVRALGELSRRIVDVGIVVNVAIVAAWAWTRTVGLPIGEFAGGPEPIGLPDAVCTAFELLLIGVLLAVRSGSDAAIERRDRARTVAAIAIVPVLGLVVVLTSLSAVAIADGLDHGFSVPGSGHIAGH
jgi:hypothetical protein